MRSLPPAAKYAAPIHGSYRQSVQLSDVDGDGADEALAFFRDAAKNPKINIYDSENGEHRLALSISGEGSSIGRIDYADLTGDGQKGASRLMADLLGSVRSGRIFSRGLVRRRAFEHRQRRVRHRRHQPRRLRRAFESARGKQHDLSLSINTPSRSGRNRRRPRRRSAPVSPRCSGCAW